MAYVDCRQTEVQLPEVTITCKEHDKILADGIRRLFRDEYFFDANVAYNDVSFKVHRLILAVFLPTLKEHMNDVKYSDVNSSANDPYSINLDSVASAAEDVQALVEFVYSGKVTIPKERIKHFGQLASDLNVESVVKAVEEYWQTEEVHTQTGKAIDYGEVVSERDPLSNDKNSMTMIANNVQSNVDESSGFFNETELQIKAVKSGNNAAAEVPSTEGALSLVHVDNSLQIAEPPSNPCPVIPRKLMENPTEDENRVISACNTKSGHKNDVIERSKSCKEEAASDWKRPKSKAKSTNPKVTTSLNILSQQIVQTLKKVKTMSNRSDGKRPAGVSSKRQTNILKGVNLKMVTSDLPTCKNCNKKFLTARSLQMHSTTCGIKSTSKLPHTGSASKEEAGVSNKQNSATKRCVDLPIATTDLPTCEKCSNKFFTVASMQKHSEICGTQRVYVCDICGHRTVRRATHKQHLRQAHDKGLPREKPNEFLKCPQCPFTCNAKIKLRGHFIRRHTTEREHKCPECEYSAMYRGEIERHVSRFHRKEVKFVCEICGSRYQMKGSLNQHMLTKHQGIKPYKCDYCGNEYTHKQTLNLHVQTKHTNDIQRHVCHICGNSYIKRWGLQYHMRRAHGTSLEPLKKSYLPRRPEAQNLENSAEDSVLKPVS